MRRLDALVDLWAASRGLFLLRRPSFSLEYPSLEDALPCPFPPRRCLSASIAPCPFQTLCADTLPLRALRPEILCLLGGDQRTTCSCPAFYAQCCTMATRSCCAHTARILRSICPCFIQPNGLDLKAKGRDLHVSAVSSNGKNLIALALHALVSRLAVALRSTQGCCYLVTACSATIGGMHAPSTFPFGSFRL